MFPDRKIAQVDLDRSLERQGGEMQHTTPTTDPRPRLLGRNLILIASYLVVLSLIAVGYAS